MKQVLSRRNLQVPPWGWIPASRTVTNQYMWFMPKALSLTPFQPLSKPLTYEMYWTSLRGVCTHHHETKHPHGMPVPTHMTHELCAWRYIGGIQERVGYCLKQIRVFRPTSRADKGKGEKTQRVSYPNPFNPQLATRTAAPRKLWAGCVRNHPRKHQAWEGSQAAGLLDCSGTNHSAGIWPVSFLRPLHILHPTR